MMWVILYLRVSTAEQAKQQYNLPSQEKKLRDYCQQKNLRILHLAVDPDRAPLVCKAFELLASGSYTTGDAVLKIITSMGLKTRRGRPLTKQSFARMLQNPIYAGWIANRDARVRGKHEPLVSEQL